jgi:hypothetical protein
MANKNPESTEVVLRDGSKGLVTVEFAGTYPALVPDEETLELLEDNLGADGENIGVGKFKRVKVPSGELNSWMVTRSGEDQAVKEITGIMVAWKARRSFWLGGEPDGSAPDCSSLDNRHPVPGGIFSPTGERGAQNPSGKCVNCPMAQFGSDPKGGRGAACKEQRLLFLVVPDALFPIVIHVPRTSIKGVTEFMMDLMNARKKYHQVEVGLTLVKDKNKANQEYNKIKIRKIRDLEPGECDATKLYGTEIRALIDQKMVATFEDTSETDGGGISVTPEEMPA